MNKEQGTAFLQALGAKDFSYGDKWIRCQCPLAPFLHKSGHDTMPSFGLSIDKSKHSTYHCFSCQTGSPTELVQALELHTHYGQAKPGKYQFSKAREILENEKLQVIPLPEYSEFGSPGKMFIPWEEGVLNGYPSALESPRAIDYLAYRAIPVEVAAAFDLRVDPQRHMLVCPYRDVYGRLGGARGRLMDFGEKHNALKHYDYTLGQNNSIFCWFNEGCMNLPGPIAVVEGQFDAMRLWQAGFKKVVANMTSKPSQRKMEKLAYTAQAILFLDNDLPGQEAQVQWADELVKLQVQVGVVDWDGAPKSGHHVQRDGPGDPKDPDETDLAWIAQALTN